MKTAERKQEDGLTKVCQTEHGFSLIEMMVAIVVISVGLLSIVGISAYVSRANGTSNTLSVVTTVAQSEADKLRGAVWSQVTEDPRLTVGGNVDYASSDTAHRTTITNTPAGTLNVSWRVVAGPATTGDMRTITLRVVQDLAPDRLAAGFSVTIIISRS
jgi:prepilin-type N-terminal cleavage/methylation domain-containing protein